MLDVINGCANSEVARVDGEESCKPVDPGSAAAVVFFVAECSKLARGADGQHPCTRQPPEGSDPAQIVVERCRPPQDGYETPDVPDDGTTKPECPKADLAKFLNMALPAKDFSFITTKIGGPQPPPATNRQPIPSGTRTPGGISVPGASPVPGIVHP